MLKVGDKVEIIGECNIGKPELIGKTGSVKEDWEDGYYTVNINGRPFSSLVYNASSLKLVTEPKFKKGDRVEIGKNNICCPTGDATVVKYSHKNENGHVYIVTVDSEGQSCEWMAYESSMTLLKEPVKEVKPETFWCIYVDGTGGFAHKHPTQGEAKTEAERLAKQQQNRNRKVHILQEISYCISPEAPVEWHETTQGKPKRDSKGKFTK